ncbi:FAD-linked oxidase C-terminal domain-containing protein [Blastococcus saxobsidens]|uniref:FAD-linked oxidase C-terminal domain-containing protein n=1 Tax=Blastococcus saxobsidens TaxID=138336 RepID=UPI001F5EB22D|nr:FAD-linked oxidase C-terminal domain-containing protein [Blastococcus saxobsidens]
MTTTTATWVAELTDAVGADGVLTDVDVTASYDRDQAMLAPAGTPAAVVFPRRTDDVVAVPRSRIGQFLDGCDRIAEDRGLVVGVVGHAGDGNMHPTVVFDPADDDQRTRAFGAFDDILELGLAPGGTTTGEHGVGVLKVDWLEREIGPVALDVHRSIKAALDPAGLLNPGTVFRAGPRTAPPAP